MIVIIRVQIKSHKIGLKIIGFGDIFFVVDIN